MREIKFRGKKSFNSEWVYGDLVQNTNDGVCIVCEILHVDGAEYNVEDYPVIKETVGQFTGLKDKNGKEIYEGDILSHPDFLDLGLKVEIIDGCTMLAGWDCIRTDLCKGEVKGNIHENPELL